MGPKAITSVIAVTSLPSRRAHKLHRHSQVHPFVTSSPVLGGNTVKRPQRLRFSDSPLIPIAAPLPTASYIAQAQIEPARLTTPQQLLLVLDLNGTLLARKEGSTIYTPRPSLQRFLNYCFTNHSVLIWSSAKPHNVAGICMQLFTPEQRNQLVGEWGRDTLELTPDQYKERVQVYKRLSRIWDSPQILKYQHPDSASGGSWGQHNTILVDDSVEKAASEPLNHIKVPEFVPKMKERGDVLGQVVGWLEEARGWGNISAFVGQR
ncbi:MAG: hypothetical protein Q9164_006879, partial [Protoblastenia rupestris]